MTSNIVMWSKIAPHEHFCSTDNVCSVWDNYDVWNHISVPSDHFCFFSFKFLFLPKFSQGRKMRWGGKPLELICWESTLALILALIPVLVLVLVLVQAGAVLCYQIIVFLKWACQGAHELNDNSSELGRKSISSILNHSIILNHGTTHLTYRIPGIRVKNLPVTRLPLRVLM